MRKFFVICILIFSIFQLRAQSSKDSLRKHVVKLSEQAFPRNAENVEYLNRAADYIRANFLRSTQRVFFQKYEIERVLFKNVVASVGPDTGYRIIVGANYDVHGNTPGADANASGVAALIELTRLLSKIKNLPFRIDLVAFTLCDYDSLSAEKWGNYMHAKSLMENNIKVLGVLTLAGIGFFTDVPHTQRYTHSYLKWVYGHRGNFISLYLEKQAGFFPNQIRRYFKQYVKGLKIVCFKPLFSWNKFSEGIQAPYVKMGYPTVSISNTGPYRNKYYHYDVDTYETLDYQRMAAVVNMIYETLTRYKQ